MDLTLKQLEYFIATVEAGTMTAAAKKCFVSQSAISLAVSELERGLGVQLIIRQNPRRLALTQAGRRLLADARQVLSGIEEMQWAARTEGETIAGTLKLGCYRTLGPFVLPPLIEGFEVQHPDVKVDLLEDGTDELCERLASGDVEVAILYDLDIPMPLETVELTTFAPYVLVSPDHPLAAAETVSAADLANEDLILFTPPSRYYLSLLRQSGVEPRIRYECANFETVRSITARGIGYALFHQRPAISASYEGRPLCIREFREEMPTLRMIIAHGVGQRLTRRAETFVEYCRTKWAADAEGASPG
ncbi:LysR family transcriptional regulator [Amycolatopsis jejuensis]|uniref:LysR family transcriptional regulator n=1 Tax=Amycolatopsis jejuensis TaxID=330084 RepID=UPI000526E1DB|nr:LysR family transcriptional regulator [Amycolatopsis jejuensis]